MKYLGLILLPGDEVPDPDHHLDVLLDLLGHGDALKSLDLLVFH